MGGTFFDGRTKQNRIKPTSRRTTDRPADAAQWRTLATKRTCHTGPQSGGRRHVGGVGSSPWFIGFLFAGIQYCCSIFMAHSHCGCLLYTSLVIGQMLDALKSGKYDVNKTALLITQTGGGCRASNYVYLLRKALEKNHLTQVPVITLNLSKLESHPGFQITKTMIVKAIYACVYGDMMMCLANQCRPYEKIPGHTDQVIKNLTGILSNLFLTKRYLRLKENYMRILNAFKAIGLEKTEKVKVGIVGEIYMKYAPLGNNQLEQYLVQEGAEVVMTGVLDFLLYCFNNTFVDVKLYKEDQMKYHWMKWIFRYVVGFQEKMADVIRKNSDFRPPSTFYDVQKAVQGYINQGVKMGEGWLLTGEMVEMIEHGVNNIVCTQPFGCLPNHIVAKGMIRAIKNKHEDANIVAVDYDPGATRTNQENRIKLMLANANKKLQPQTQQQKIVVVDYGEKSNLA